MEAFAQYLKQGLPACRAYEKSGYRPNRGNAIRLKTNEIIRRRLAELTRSLAVKTAVTIASLTEQIVEDREFARQLDNPSAAHAATISLGKLHGHFIDRKEVGQPGDFANMSEAEVKEKIAADFGADALKALEILLAARAGPPEVVIESAPIDKLSIDKPKVDEAERSLAIYRR
jgi:hypothetical protein